MSDDRRRIEKVAHERLVEELGETVGGRRFALYVTAKKALVEHILPNIKGVVPNFTDHGLVHVDKVLDNAGELLGIDKDPSVLSGVEYYSLIMAVLFHDAGNIVNREEHQRNVGQIYDFCRSEAERDRGEKLIIMRAIQAHCGHNESGSRDTLLDLRDDKGVLDSKPVRLCDIAAVLRLADELAEGKHRTSLYMLNCHKIADDSVIHHVYADMTRVLIDRGNGRIAVTYHINVERDGSTPPCLKEEDALRHLMNYTYHRIEKLNQERKYARNLAGNPCCDKDCMLKPV